MIVFDYQDVDYVNNDSFLFKLSPEIEKYPKSKLQKCIQVHYDSLLIGLCEKGPAI